MDSLKFTVCFLFLINIFFRKVLCNSCVENNEYSVTCYALDDFLSYPHLGQWKIVHVTHPEAFSGKSSQIDMFMCTGQVFEKYKAVKYLDMSKFRVITINPNCFKGMNALETVNLSNNNLTTIDMNVFRTSDEMNIRKIILDNNGILNINLSTVILPELETLQMTNNSLTSFYLRTANLPKIEILDLEGNDIWRFGIESKTMTSLDLSHNCIKTFSKAQMILPNLRHLRLDGNHLTEVNDDMFGNMPKVKYVHLAHNLLHTVFIPHLRLVYLDLNYNEIKTMGNITASLINHSSIHVNFNKVFEMISPNQLGDLTELVCNFCNIHLIGPYFLYDLSPAMESVSLRSNLLTSAKLFESRQDDLNLISIDLSYNQIKKIDSMTFSKLSKTINLYISNNEIETIAPEAFNYMTMLHTLDLSNNYIYEVPPNAFDRAPIVLLLLNGNNMAYFPIPGWDTETNEIYDDGSVRI